MQPALRTLGLCVAVLMLANAAWGWGTPAGETVGTRLEQTGTAAVPPPSHPTQALSLEQRADIFMARKNYDQAADFYYQSLQRSSFKDAVVWNKLGIAFQQQNKFQGAHKAYANATHLNKNFAEAWNNLGTVYFMQKKYGRSVRYYQRAIEVKKDNASFHMNLGTAYYHQKKFPLAVEEYRTALGIDPNVLNQQSPLGTVVHAGGADVDFFFYMAKAYASIGNAEEAVRYLRRALEDGFKDPKRIEEDPDFKKISQHPAFVELMRNPPVAIKE